MDLLYLQHKRKQLLQQELSLPVIQEKILPQAPQTSARPRKQKRQQQYASETGLSPQEEHLQDQIRMLFHSKQRQPSTPRQSLKQIPIDSSETKHKKNVSLPHISMNYAKPKTNNSSEDQRELTHRPKASLDSILLNKNEFIQQYFTQLKHKQNKINL